MAKVKGVKEKVCKGGGSMMPDRPVDLWTIQDHLARYAFAAEFVKDKIVLDVACGPGYGSAHLFEKGARMVVGGDIFMPAIEAARKLYIKPGVEFLVLDATKLPFADNSFEVVVSMETIEHLEQYRDYLRECRRVLKPGGIFICSTPNKWHDLPITYGPDHVHEFHLAELREVLSHFFKEIQLYAQGYFDEAEKTRIGKALQKRQKQKKPDVEIMSKVGNLIKLLSHYTTPKLYYLLSFLYMKIVVRLPYIRLSQATDWDKILDEMGEEHRIAPIDNSSLTPKTIIAVARK